MFLQQNFFWDWVNSLTGLDKALAEGIFGTEMYVVTDIFRNENVYRFNNGRTIRVPLGGASLMRNNFIDTVVELIEKEIGTVEGCKRLLESFAACEANREEANKDE